ncbi:MAG: stage 0 sporulation family protein [Clostridia bacterium]|nr:stage 0 sporulation family protein [Clostridia bacterium]
MIKIVSVKFKNGGKTYYFAPGKETYEKGMGVIVETAKGLEYATVVLPEGEVDESEVVSPLKPVVRIATKRDEEQVKRNAERRGEALKTAQEKIAARGLEMKLVDCEFAFDGSKVVFFFTAENRVDFRELIKDLSSAFRMRIELRQINIRDEIKITGGLAPCGRECCCIGCMPEPKKVSVKMAKNQGLSLNPGKISGLCGRLMCCLAYENEYYAEACKKVPKIGSEAETPDGKGTVVNVNMLKMLVKVKIEQNENVSYHEYPVDEIRFMRGNVVMGKESFDEDDDSDVLPEEGAESAKPPVAINTDKQRDRQQGHGDRQNERRGGGNNDRRDNRDNRNDRRDNNRDRNKNRGDRPDGNNDNQRREKKPRNGNPNPENTQSVGGENNRNNQGERRPHNGRNRHHKRGGKNREGSNPPEKQEN